MTVSTTVVRSGPFTPDGVTTTFPFAFVAMSVTELNVVGVVSEVVTSPALYDVVLTSAGGSVIFIAAPILGAEAFYIQANPAFSQQLVLSDNAPFDAGDIEHSFDRAVARDLILLDDISRCLSVAPGDTPGGLILPPASQRANSFLGFGPDGLEFVLGTFSTIAVSVLSTFIASIATDTGGGALAVASLVTAAEAEIFGTEVIGFTPVFTIAGQDQSPGNGSIPFAGWVYTLPGGATAFSIKLALSFRTLPAVVDRTPCLIAGLPRPSLLPFACSFTAASLQGAPVGVTADLENDVFRLKLGLNDLSFNDLEDTFNLELGGVYAAAPLVNL